jgi:hypothetical protein
MECKNNKFSYELEKSLKEMKRTKYERKNRKIFRTKKSWRELFNEDKNEK